MVKTFSIVPMTVSWHGLLYFGKIDVNDNPLTLEADTLDHLKQKMKVLVYENEGIHLDDFDCHFIDEENNITRS